MGGRDTVKKAWDLEAENLAINLVASACFLYVWSWKIYSLSYLEGLLWVSKKTAQMSKVLLEQWRRKKFCYYRSNVYFVYWKTHSSFASEVWSFLNAILSEKLFSYVSIFGSFTYMPDSIISYKMKACLSVTFFVSSTELQQFTWGSMISFGRRPHFYSFSMEIMSCFRRKQKK